MYTTEKTRAGLKIYDSKRKHIKTVSQDYETVLTDEIITSLNTGKIRLSEAERDKLDKAVKELIIPQFLERLKKEEKYVYELVENAKVTGVREVKGKDSNRYELVFDNEVKLKIPAEIYHIHDVKLPTAYLNY